MRFEPSLIKGTLMRRYKRFLADVRLEDGREVVAHCPNPGAMTHLADEHMTVWLRHESSPKRKLEWSWILSDGGSSWVGIHTILANQLVSEAITHNLLPCFEDMVVLKKEPAIDKLLPSSEGVRLDFLLENQAGEAIYLEVKSVTMRLIEEQAAAVFPDAITQRGTKHMKCLTTLAKRGIRTMVFFLIQREDCDFFRPYDELDENYGQSLREASQAGVIIKAAACKVSPHEIRADKMMDVRLERHHGS